MYHSFENRKVTGNAMIKRHQGSTLVIAIFVIIVLSLIATALVRMQSSSSESVVYEVMGTRAYAAAQSGIQWQLTQIFPLGVNVITTCPADETSYSFTSEQGLKNCSYKVTCEDSAVHGGVQYYTITSTGTCKVGEVITSRTIEVQARSM